jgi:NAD(P)-dependent dehydrogenase (short-subunit alcohol dehydrogenase family)
MRCSKLVVPTDVTNSQAVQALARAAAARFGGIDVWINNVGVGAVGGFTETPLKAHHRVIETNLVGHINGAHTALPYFIGQNCGVLINLLSLGAWAAAPYAAAYSASKFGLRGFSEALRAELTRWPDIHVCDVYPAFMDTPGMAHAANYSGKQLRPMPPLYDPREVAHAVAALIKSPTPVTTVGAAAHAVRAGHALSPWLSGWLGAKVVERYFRRAEPAPRSDGNLFSPSVGSAIDGGYRQRAASPGLLGKLVPLLGAAAAGGLLFALALQRKPATPRRSG